MKVEKLLI